MSPKDLKDPEDLMSPDERELRWIQRSRKIFVEEFPMDTTVLEGYDLEETT
jgi:hypothetical protein